MIPTVHFVPEFKDHFRAYATALLARKWVLFLFVGVFIVIPWMSAAIFLGIAAWTDRAIGSGSIVVLLIAPIAAILGFGGLAWLQARGNMRNAPAVRGEHRYAFSPEGVLITAPGLENRVDLKSITKYHESRFGTMMFSGSCPILFVPTRGFASDKDKRAVLELLNQTHESEA